MDIYSHLCLTDTAIKLVLIDTGPRPFTLKCLSPWGSVSADPDINQRADIISDVLVNVRVLGAADRITPISWLKQQDSRRVNAESGHRCDQSLMMRLIQWFDSRLY